MLFKDFPPPLSTLFPYSPHLQRSGGMRSGGRGGRVGGQRPLRHRWPVSGSDLSSALSVRTPVTNATVQSVLCCESTTCQQGKHLVSFFSSTYTSNARELVNGI